MPGDAVKKISSFIESSWKLLSIVGAIVVIIYEISVVWIKIDSTEKELNSFKEEMKKELELRDDRSDKRYQRAIEMYEELKKHGIALEQELEQHRIEDAKEEGKNEMFRELHKD